MKRSKNNRLKSARNSCATRIHKLKPDKNSGKRIPYKTDPSRIKILLQCLDEGNLPPVRNFLKSFLPQKVVLKPYAKDGLTKLERIAKYKAELIAKATKEEKLAKIILKDMKVKFTFQQEFICKNGKFYFMDFYLPLIRVGIEIDGGYHFTDIQQAKDADRTKDLEKNGIDIYRFTNKDVLDIEKFRKGVVEIIERYSIS